VARSNNALALFDALKTIGAPAPRDAEPGRRSVELSADQLQPLVEPQPSQT
jgi:hypothetical protein